MQKIILFYKYVEIQYPKSILKEQKRVCEELGIKGRIILAHEGINGTLGGTHESLEAYKKHMDHHPLFSGIDFKESPGCANDFPRLRIVVKNEIVYLGADTTTINARDGGSHLSPEQAHKLMEQAPENLVILDARNNYESRIGTFIGSICPDIENFRDLPAYIDQNLDLFKDKQVLMHCTGGIRCERASAYLKYKNVAQQIYQISGGIHRYTEQFPEGFFRGKNYVFDARGAIKVNNDVIASCDFCTTPCDDYTNCMNSLCNTMFIACKECIKKYENSCSKECQEALASGKAPLRKKPLPQPGIHVSAHQPHCSA